MMVESYNMITYVYNTYLYLVLITYIFANCTAFQFNTLVEICSLLDISKIFKKPGVKTVGLVRDTVMKHVVLVIHVQGVVMDNYSISMSLTHSDGLH